MLTIRKQTEADKGQIWEIIKTVISTGDTYYFAPDSSKEKMLDYWFDPKKNGYVAVLSEPPASVGGNPQLVQSTAADSKNQLVRPTAADGLSADEKIAGIFYITQNFPDLASHIANAAYMVAPRARGKGVGRMMAEYSIKEAQKLGFRAIQFNFVVKSNFSAVKLWKDLGFEVIGEIPEAFNHAQQGLTNVLIMYRKL
jgi:ribosomal protein S18 acetylase RimI-like enzyme